MTNSRAVTYVAAGVLAVLVVGALVVILAGNRRPVDYPDGTPQAAMQDYLAAWTARDFDTAYGYFSDEIRSGTSLADYRTGADAYGRGFTGESQAVYIEGVEGSGDQVSLHLNVERYSSGGNGNNSSYTTQTSVRMVRQPDGWKLDELLAGVDPIPLPVEKPTQ
jgi:hypothetical protein